MIIAKILLPLKDLGKNWKNTKENAINWNNSVRSVYYVAKKSWEMLY